VVDVTRSCPGRYWLTKIHKNSIFAAIKTQAN
jgi:hypothetical protein